MIFVVFILAALGIALIIKSLFDGDPFFVLIGMAMCLVALIAYVYGGNV